MGRASDGKRGAPREDRWSEALAVGSLAFVERVKHDLGVKAARRVLEGNGNLTFEQWKLHVAGKDFSIWPWVLTEPERVTDAKTYTATLQSTSGGSLAIHLKMALGQDRILAPSSALIAVSGLATALNDSERTRLARVLLGINAHYGSPENIGLGSESGALAAAMPALVVGGRMTISDDERALRLSMAQDLGRVFGRITFRIAPALLLVFVYGVVNLVSMGSAPTHYWHTYVPLVGAVASLLSCLLYPMAMF